MCLSAQLKRVVMNKKVYQFHIQTKKNVQLHHTDCKIVGKRFSMYRFHGTWLMNWYTKNVEFFHLILVQRDRIIRSLVLVLPICSLFLVAGSGMDEELQHLSGANSQLINNIKNTLSKFSLSLIYLHSVEAMRIERFRTFVKHHSTVEKYMANRN